MKKNVKNKIKTISKAINIISIIVLVIFLFILCKVNMFPFKYYIIISITLLILELIYTLMCIKMGINKKLKFVFQGVANFLAILFIIIEVFVSLKLNGTINFLNENLQAKFTTDVYYFVVNSKSSYSSIEQIKDKIVYYYKDTEYLSDLIEAVNEKVSVKIEYVDELNDFLLKTDDIENIILINSGTYESLIDNDDTYKESTKILDQVEIKIAVDEDNKSTKDVTKDSFIVYLSGIDTRSNSMPSRSLSDVNMFIVVNPNTKKILLVNIPRDYYVQIHGTTGLKDKLTHAGSIGGVNLSKSTLEDLVGYEADYYVRFNFNAVVNLVDTIGGITINSDVNYSFTCSNNKSCTINPGDNDVDGQCALAFARERYAYSSGDRHRGENQQQIITKIINKVSSSTNIITNYSKILNSLSGSFDSDLSTDDITSLIQFQLSNMTIWTIEKTNLDGTTGMTYTHSYPNQLLSVIYPDEETIKTAKLKIQEVLDEK